MEVRVVGFFKIKYRDSVGVWILVSRSEGYSGRGCFWGLGIDLRVDVRIVVFYRKVIF